MVTAPLTLRSVQARAVEVPAARPLGTNAQTMTSASLLLIDVETEEGIVGPAYLFCYMRMAPALIAAGLTDIADALHEERIAPVDFSNGLPATLPIAGRARPCVIWRHLATMEGALPWAWQALRPLYTDGSIVNEAAGLRQEVALPAIRADRLLVRLIDSAAPPPSVLAVWIRAAVEPFAGDVIIKMLVVCAFLRGITA